MKFTNILKQILSPVGLRQISKWAERAKNAADAANMMAGHTCNSKCWHFPGFENGLVRCSCRWEEGPTYRLYNGSSHEDDCWVHRVWLELGGLGPGGPGAATPLKRVSPGLWRIG